MSSLYSANLKIELIGTGDQTGVWGGTTNTNLGTAIEQAIVGKASLVTGDFTANVATLTLTDTNASQTARAFVLDVTATLSAAGTINVPAVQKPYIVFNNTVGGFDLTVKVTGLTGVVVPNGKRMLVYNNGTDIIDGLNYLNGTATNAITATSATSATTATTATTATNLAAGVANNIPYQTGAGATAYITVPTNPGYVLGWNGTNFTWVVAPAATTAISLVGGSAGVVPYQSATDTTAFTAVGVSGKPLVSTGTTAPTFATLGISGGGTNSTATPTAGAVPYGTGTALAYTAAGTAGQFLQSAGAGVPVWAASGISQVTTATTATTLTSTPTLLQITPTSYGVTVTLPDATTCSVGGPLHCIDNRGAYPVRVVNTSGTLLGFVFAGVVSYIGLDNNSTAGGVWNISSNEVVGASAQLLTTNMAVIDAVIDIGSSQEVLIGRGISNANCYSVVYNRSTNTFGSVTLIRTATFGNSLISAVLSATNQVLVVSVATGSTSFEAVTLSISGTTITVNTAATATLSATISAFADGCGLIAVGSSFVTSYTVATPAAQIRALSISGNTVTIGAASVLGGTTGGLIAASGSIVIATSVGAGVLTVAPYTVSGSTLTIGTGATAATGTYSASGVKLTPLGTRWAAIVYNSVNGTTGVVISLSATTITLTIAVLVTDTSALPNDAIVVGSNKILYLHTTTTNNANILTDTAGTASAGTAITLSSGTTRACIYTDGTNVTVGNASNISSAVDCSGASPVLINNVPLAGLPVATSNSVLSRSPNNGCYATNALRGISGTSWAGYLALFPVKIASVGAGANFYRGKIPSEFWITNFNSTTAIVKFEGVV